MCGVWAFSCTRCSQGIVDLSQLSVCACDSICTMLSLAVLKLVLQLGATTELNTMIIDLIFLMCFPSPANKLFVHCESKNTHGIIHNFAKNVGHYSYFFTI